MNEGHENSFGKMVYQSVSQRWNAYGPIQIFRHANHVRIVKYWTVKFI